MNDDTTDPQGSEGPLLPPPPEGAEYFDRAVRMLIGVEKRFSGYQTELFGPQGHVQAIHKKLADLETKLEARDRRAVETARRAEANIELVLESIGTFRDDLLSLTARVNVLDRRANEFDKRMQAIGTTFDEYEDRLGDLESRLFVIEDRQPAATDTIPAPPAED
jgi:chromosome segregation ATPase